MHKIKKGSKRNFDYIRIKSMAEHESEGSGRGMRGGKWGVKKVLPKGER